MEPNLFPLPAPSDKLWRYLGFPELVHLLSRKTLHFTRADMFTDRFEGSASALHWQRALNIVDAAEAFKAEWRERRNAVAINCWHMSEHESLAMWELYARRGIAIQSTYDRLNRGLPDSKEIVPGIVEYADHRTAPMNTPSYVANFYRKRPSFAHEREFRLTITRMGVKFVGPGAILYDHNPEGPNPPGFGIRTGAVPEAGLDVPIDPEIVIENVYVAPDSPPWIQAAVEDLVVGLGSKIAVKPSDLDVSPIY